MRKFELAALLSIGFSCSSSSAPQDAGRPHDAGPADGSSRTPDSSEPGGRGSSGIGGASGRDGGHNSTGDDASTADATTTDAGGMDASARPGMCSGSKSSTNSAGPKPAAPNAALTVPAMFTLETVAAVNGARDLAALPNGDLLIATLQTSVYLVPNAEGDQAGAPVVFTTIADAPVSGVAFASSICTILVGSQHGVYAIPYQDAQQSATVGAPIAKVRQGMPTPGSDGDVHKTTAVAYTDGKVYAGVGSGCNACVEVDPTRATIQEMDVSGANMTTRATRIRNAIGMAVNPATGTLWAGGAGQDNLAWGHPFEFFDAVTLHSGIADYGWPDCEENHHAYTTGANCAATVVPLVELPAYDTIVGAAFYPRSITGTHVFPEAYRSGVFIAAHGSWHNQSNQYVHPRVVFVPMNGDSPATPVNWSDPTVQWGGTDFIGGFGNGPNYLARPTGIAVGAQGSLFVADDANGLVYRVRPK